MNKWTPRKWAARRKMGKRPERFMRRDQAQAKRAQRRARRMAQNMGSGGTITGPATLSASPQVTPIIAG